MIVRFYQGWFQMLLIDLPLFMAATMSVSSFYMISQREIDPKGWKQRLKYLPFMMSVGIGLSVSNSRAVIEALFGIKSSFKRTPKYCIESAKDRPAPKTKYRRKSGAIRPSWELTWAPTLRSPSSMHSPTRTI